MRPGPARSDPTRPGPQVPGQAAGGVPEWLGAARLPGPGPGAGVEPAGRRGPAHGGGPAADGHRALPGARVEGECCQCCAASGVPVLHCAGGALRCRGAAASRRLSSAARGSVCGQPVQRACGRDTQRLRIITTPQYAAAYRRNKLQYAALSPRHTGAQHRGAATARSTARPPQNSRAWRARRWRGPACDAGARGRRGAGGGRHGVVVLRSPACNGPRDHTLGGETPDPLAHI
jgi:hypothetical protein